METADIKKIKFELDPAHTPVQRDNSQKLQEALRSIASIPPGSQWFTAATDPDKKTGVDGDYALNTESGDLFRKENGSWVKVGNIKGSTINTGSGPP